MMVAQDEDFSLCHTQNRLILRSRPGVSRAGVSKDAQC
jgi:hypothetical protein